MTSGFPIIPEEIYIREGFLQADYLFRPADPNQKPFLREYPLSKSYQRMLPFHRTRMQLYHWAVWDLQKNDTLFQVVIANSSLQTDFAFLDGEGQIRVVVEFLTTASKQEELEYNAALKLYRYYDILRYSDRYYPYPVEVKPDRGDSTRGALERLKEKMRPAYKFALGITNAHKLVCRSSVAGHETRAAIAKDLHLSNYTVEDHCKSINWLISKEDAPGLKGYKNACGFLNKEGLLDD